MMRTLLTVRTRADRAGHSRRLCAPLLHLFASFTLCIFFQHSLVA